MNLLTKYSKMKFSDKQKFLELLFEDLEKLKNHQIKLEIYMKSPELKQKRDLSKDKS